jgi:hypothetical protein
MPDLPGLLKAIGSDLADLPDVYSTAQWGGRAWKVPGPGGSKAKPKLLAHVTPTRDERAISVTFKLPRDRAAAAADAHAWIEPSSFGKLGRSGWLAATLTTKRQWKTLRPLLAESREQYPRTEPARAEPARRGRVGSDDARRVDRVMKELGESGWSPGDDDGFD